MLSLASSAACGTVGSLLMIQHVYFSQRMQNEEGVVLRGRFNRPRVMMDVFEYQGTKAAELAGEDYAAQRRVHLHVSSCSCAPVFTLMAHVLPVFQGRCVERGQLLRLWCESLGS